jgi:protein KTI12
MHNNIRLYWSNFNKFLLFHFPTLHNDLIMALILLSGFPCCGKTTFATKLKDEIVKMNENQRVVIVNEEMLRIEKLSGYMDSTHEKFSRGLLKSAIDREVSVTDTIVIADSLNYIKGYRYELYCIARALRLRTCCVYVEAPDNISDCWNTARRTADVDTYTDEM